MNYNKGLTVTSLEFYRLSKNKMSQTFFEIRDTLIAENRRLTLELATQLQKVKLLQEENDKTKTSNVNAETNKPTSKQPEWDKDGNPKPRTGKGNKKRKKKRKKRKGSGNKKKKDLILDSTNHNCLEECSCCGEDLSNVEPLDTKNSRIVEDIVAPPEKTVVTKETQERKWCPKCKKIITATCQTALPGSDFGLNTLILAVYFWVVCSLSLPNIQAYLNSFMKLVISTSGLSKAMIRLAKILAPVSDEILDDVKGGFAIWADETGWRINGELHWLWIFANTRSAYYFVDKSRGSPVVEALLGPLFFGVLVTDAWGAYNSIACVGKQTCMAHIFRKIRKFVEVFPEYKSIMRFYIKLRRIIKDGEKLQKQRAELKELVFCRRHKLLHQRLNQLLKWQNPNSKLKDVIKKVRRQQEHILTFVEHEGVPSHNNYGEYIIRKAVVKRKISGGSKSIEGAKAYACLQSIAQTCHLRKISFLSFLKETLAHYLRTGRPLLLSEYEVNSQIAKEAA